MESDIADAEAAAPLFRRSYLYRGHHMALELRSLCIAVLLLLLQLPEADAHPHVWVTVHAEVLYAPNGAVTGIRHAWAFDDMYSAFAVQGLQQATKGEFTREELKSLAEVNATSLNEYEYFTYASINGKEVRFATPTDYWMEYGDSVLTLHLTLPLKTPVVAKTLQIEIYDPTIFIDFELAKGKPVSLVGAPPRCQMKVDLPRAATPAEQFRLGQLDSNPLGMPLNFGQMFSNKIVVKCP